ncbi:MAG: phosphate acyltransferase PlsX [Myxococcales bacterium]|nr:phosphate acyltransferase PlsX [Myxococcales bacterium]
MGDGTVTVALDAMGGDHGLEATVEGAAVLSREASDLHILLVGDAPAISARLDEIPYDPSKLRVVSAEGCVGMDAKPREALDRMPHCSVATTARLVAEGQADAMVSAGNTGATILAASDHFERLPGVRRAALAAVYPTATRHGPHNDPFALMLDVGATLNATSADLVSMAVMGSAYSSIISNIEAPRVALLSNGTEATKGTAAIVEAHGRLLSGTLNFAGNVEGLDIPRGTVDVVVCEGFLGNVVLKMLEGVSEVFVDVARKASGRKLQWRMGLAMLGGGLKEIRRLTDWKSYGGAPLLGLDQVVIKAHGRSEARAVRNAVKVAAKAAKGDLIGRIRTGVTDLGLTGSDA